VGPGPPPGPSPGSATEKKQTKNKRSLPQYLTIERLNNALFGKEIAVGLWLGLFRNAISLVLNVYLLVHKNLGTTARAHRAHGFISYWSSVLSSVV